MKNNSKANLKNLYFDIEKKNFIQFSLNVLTTCESILTNYNDDIKSKITPLYTKTKQKKIPNNKSRNSSFQVDISDFDFFIIEEKLESIKDGVTSSLTRFKINHEVFIIQYFENPCYNLYFLPINKNSVKNNRIKSIGHIMMNELYEDIEKSNYNLIKKNNDDFLSKTIIYFYSIKKKKFSKQKGSVDEKKIIIYSWSDEKKILMEIFISEIIKVIYINDSDNNSIDTPKYIKIHTINTEYIFAEFKENLFQQWQNAINQAMVIYKNFSAELNLDTKISGEKINKFATNHSIIDDCFILNKIITNDEKRKMFLAEFPDKHISSIFNDIVMYKNLINKNEYFNSWMKFKQILSYINYYTDDNKNGDNNNNIICEKEHKIFNEDRLNIYKKIEEESYITFQKINQDPQMSMGSFNTVVNDGLKNILDINLFNDLYDDLYNMYIVPYFENEKKNLEEERDTSCKPALRQKFQLLLALYSNQIFNMDTNNFNLLNTNKKIIKENGIES